MNVDELAELAQTYRDEEAPVRHEVRVCMAASCQSSGAVPVHDALEKSCADRGASCKVKGVGCMGLCSAGPLVAVADHGADLARSTLYRDVKPEDAADIAASVDGVPVEGGAGRKHPVVLGKGAFIPGFEEELVGMKAGEEKTFELTFPETYHEKTLAGKPATFHVTVGLVKERNIAEGERMPLETGTVEKSRPVGSDEEVGIDVRVISATHRDLEDEVASGRFRQDFFFRIHVFAIELPPLRDRQADIPVLAQHFLVFLVGIGARLDLNRVVHDGDDHRQTPECDLAIAGAHTDPISRSRGLAAILRLTSQAVEHVPPQGIAYQIAGNASRYIDRKIKLFGACADFKQITQVSQ